MPGEIVTYTTRRESYEELDTKDKYEQIEYILSRFPEGLTAREIVHQMKLLGYIPVEDMNFARPRISEMLRNGKLTTGGKKECNITHKNVAVFRLRKEERQMTLGDYLW